MFENTNGKIVTFYSFKGGTGRSMALANVAWILACAGKKVLAIDWDLEAPGLHRYFYPFLIDKELTASDGVIDWVTSFVLEGVTAHEDSTATDWYKEYANILRFALSIDYEFPKGGRLDFVPAGRQGLSYATRVNSFDWQRFYEVFRGGSFLEEAKKQMRDEYDYILIDSRTGVSDTSGICTIQMPDIIVPCFTLNNQGIDGTLNITKLVFDKRKESGLKVFPVPMRLDNAENDKLRRRRNDAKRKFYPFPNHLVDGDWEKYWDEVPVSYVPYYSYEEVLAIFAQGSTSTSIFNVAEKLTRYIVQTTDPLIDRNSLPHFEAAERVLAQYAGTQFETDMSAELVSVAENALAPLSAKDLATARRVIQRLVKMTDETSDVYARQILPLNSFPWSDRRLIQKLHYSRVLRQDTDSTTNTRTVRIASDELLLSWRRLREWLSEDRAFLLWLDSIRQKNERWQRAKADSGGAGTRTVIIPDSLLLSSDDEVLQARHWLKERYVDIYPAERSFIESSLQKRPVPGDAETIAPERKRTFTIPSKESENLKKAIQILRGRQGEPSEMLELAKKLKGELRFSHARRLLARARNHESVARDKRLRKTIFQQLALCTYKDQDLPIDERLNRALSILNEIADFDKTTDQETLGLVGAIYKRKWQVDNQRQNLERSLSYYMRGYQQGPANDQGYTGINAAFVLDQLASLERTEAERAGTVSQIAAERSMSARDIRSHIVDIVGALIDDPNHKWIADQWWYYATVAEAHFGLQNYAEAVQWIVKGQSVAEQIFEWELESCARQLAALARLQDEPQFSAEPYLYTPAWAALEEAFGIRAVRSAFVGKVGLALSGGGFRASLYHLGVLAQLAERDVLRKVEALSCVSGGSIVGAHYYLKVRKLLQSKTDVDVTREDYIQIVREMIDEFLTGVQRNIRVRVAANPLKTLKMFWSSDYSRTTRAAELYEDYLYSQVESAELGLWLNELTIAPRAASGNEVDRDHQFAPKYQNWRRNAKVPILVLNASTLNTGHTWQFTASWMGETPSSIDSEIDGNDRLRRMYYQDAPARHQRIRLGQAVAASACVPGLFEPLTLDNLYPDRIVRLVDGGVCDNQGVTSLLEQDCQVVLVSDASGQMESQPAASRGILGVLRRTNSIFQARVRDAEYHDLKGRKRSGLLRGFMFVHLKGDLEVDPIDWINCPDPYDPSEDGQRSSRATQTNYGISKEVQKLLSAIRTDLDSFSDAEAYALMTSAYRMTEHEFKYGNPGEGFPDSPTSEPWKFLEIEPSMQVSGDGIDYLKKLLAAGSSLAFKVWQIDPVLRYGLRSALMLWAALIAWIFYSRWDAQLPTFVSDLGTSGLGRLAAASDRVARALPFVTFSQVVYIIATLFGVYFLGRILASLVGDAMSRDVVRVVRWKDTVRRIMAAVFLSTIGFVAAAIHLWFFDKRFLRLGSMEYLKKRRDSGASGRVAVSQAVRQISWVVVLPLILFLAASGKLPGSERWFGKAPAARELKAKADGLLKNGNYWGSIHVYTDALTKDPELLDAYLGRSEAYRRCSDLGAAMSDVNFVIQRNPGNAEGYYQRARIEIDGHQTEDALKDVDSAIQIKPQYADALAERGRIERLKENYDAAVSDYSRALDLDPRNHQYYLGRGIALSLQQSYTRAISDFDHAIALKSDDIDGYFERGSSYQFQYQLDAAIDNYNAAIKIQPNNPYLYNNRGFNFLWDGNYERAIDDLRIAIELKPDYADAMLNLGDAYAKSGKQNLARSQYQQALRTFNDPAIANKAQERLDTLVTTGRVTVFVTNPKDVLIADKFVTFLRSEGYVVQPNLAPMNTKGYVKYYYSEDLTNANTICRITNAYFDGKFPQPLYVAHPPEQPPQGQVPGSIRIWLPSLHDNQDK